ncbi:MAG: 2-oxo-4-hydroxy-4-carboxy-5-ureidoimidazoline decarboxylase [Bacteroidetes bacterium]|nr:2-oxo-4-hydroxy-4-carboxy-5-ureidoimidazoline decarboxylase [Bacteroidota bacterium]
MTIAELNILDDFTLKAELQKCCGSSSWVNKMISSKPFLRQEDLFTKSDAAWEDVTEKDLLEAFSHHPKIGDIANLEKKFASTKELAGNEQASIHVASRETIEHLAEGNREYENKFGFIFIICATSKSADEMLSMLTQRLSNDRITELKIASEEQHKITKLRLQKLIS